MVYQSTIGIRLFLGLRIENIDLRQATHNLITVRGSRDIG
jgi:hypothetical protein